MESLQKLAEVHWALPAPLEQLLQMQLQAELGTPELSLELRRVKLAARVTQVILETQQSLGQVVQVGLAADWLLFSLKQLLVLGL